MIVAVRDRECDCERKRESFKKRDCSCVRERDSVCMKERGKETESIFQERETVLL